MSTALGLLAAWLVRRRRLGRPALLDAGLFASPYFRLGISQQMLQQVALGGTMIALDLGSKDAAFAFLNRLRLISISNNLGDAKSIVTHPATTTHQRLSEDDRAYLGITPGLLRLSVGLG